MLRGVEAIRFAGGIGDQLLLSVPAHEHFRRTGRRLWIISEAPELFSGNPHVAGVLPPGGPAANRLFELGRVRVVRYEDRDPLGDSTRFAGQHILAEMCAQLGMTGTVAVRPWLHLSEAERASGARHGGWVAIQSGGLGARHPMPNKEWGPGRFGEVARALGKEAKLVQLGATADEPLMVEADLRGRTTLREAAAILGSCRLMVGQVGFLMHLARAVDCPAVIVYGGREDPGRTGYRENTNLVRVPPCSPCWQVSRCDHDRRCLRDIPVEEVVAACRARLAAPADRPLPAELREVLGPTLDVVRSERRR